ncbi:MAG: thioredoxin-like domain-containing protein [Planctomycetota bacterium]
MNPTPIRLMTAAILTAACVLLSAAAAGQPNDEPVRPAPTIETLLARPDLRPAAVTALKDFNFGGGDRIAKGTELRVHDIEPGGIVLDTGEFIFQAAFEDTDLLDRTAELIGSLSPAAIALTLDDLRDRPDLWPTRLTLQAGMEFTDGTRIDAGSTLALRDWKGPTIDAVVPGTSTLLTLDPLDTDLLDLARKDLTSKASGLYCGPDVPFFKRSIQHAIGSETDDTRHIRLAEADYLLIYRGSSICPRCERFTPKLIDAYEDLAKKHDNFEVVFVSDDRSASAHQSYMHKTEMPWSVVPYTNIYAAANTKSLPGRQLPLVYLVTPDGTVIDTKESNDADRIIRTLRRKLEDA